MNMILLYTSLFSVTLCAEVKLPQRYLKREYNQPYQSQLLSNEITVEYPPQGRTYGSFKKEEDDRKPVMFPAPPPSEEESTTKSAVVEVASSSDKFRSLPKNYAFSYSVKDHNSGDDFSHSQAHNGQSTKGEYRVKLPDGRMQIVSYTADNAGYRADVRYVMEDEPPKDEKLPNYVHDFTNTNNVQSYFDDYNTNHLSVTPTHVAAPSIQPPSREHSNRFSSTDDSDSYHEYHSPPNHLDAHEPEYYSDKFVQSSAVPYFKSTIEPSHEVNFLVNHVQPTKHSKPLYQHALKYKPAEHISYETTTKNSEVENDIYVNTFNYGSRAENKSPTASNVKGKGLSYHYESLPTKFPIANPVQDFHPSLQNFYRGTSAIVDVAPPNLSPARPIQANYVTLPKERLPFKYEFPYYPSKPIEDSNFQANNVETSEVKQNDQTTTTQESLTMRPHIKYNTHPAVIASKQSPQKSLLHQTATPTPQLPENYVANKPVSTAIPQLYSASYPERHAAAQSTVTPVKEASQSTENSIDSYDYSDEYYKSNGLQEYKQDDPQHFSKLVLPVTTMRPNYGAVYATKSTPAVSQQKFIFLNPSISPMYINSLEDNKPSLELSYLKEVPSNSVHLHHNADPTSNEFSEETPRPYDSFTISTVANPSSSSPLYTQATVSSEEYSKESLYSFIPSVRHEYDLGNAESSHFSSEQSQSASSSASVEEYTSTTPVSENNKRQRKAAPKENRISHRHSTPVRDHSRSHTRPRT